jgi:single-strand DNA-binding protein
MSLNLNTVFLAGHLTRDPQVKSLANDKTVASFGLAINRRYKTADGEAKEESTFVDCDAWGRTAELVGQYLVKGSPCFVEGRLKLDSWQDKDGAKRNRLKVVVDSVQFLSRGKAKEETAEGEAEAVAASPAAPASAAKPTPSATKVPGKARVPGVALATESPPF